MGKIKFMGKYLKLAIISLLVFSFAPIRPSNTRHVQVRNPAPGNDGFAVVELFTSEGCSSCPPADDFISSLPATYPTGVYVLSFHVDYWDRLGWKDPFSQASFTQRQKQYKDILMLNSVYTPQAVLNGKIEMVGSDSIRLRQTIDMLLAQTSNPPIDATAHANNTSSVTVDFTLTGKKQGTLQAALVQSQASTDVKNGENAGRRLHHANIVRELKSSNRKTGSLTLAVPAGVRATDCKVIVFLQDNETLQVGGARLLDIH
jgi:hypothetical protein